MGYCTIRGMISPDRKKEKKAMYTIVATLANRSSSCAICPLYEILFSFGGEPFCIMKQREMKGSSSEERRKMPKSGTRGWWRLSTGCFRRIVGSVGWMMNDESVSLWSYGLALGLWYGRRKSRACLLSFICGLFILFFGLL